MCLGLIVRAKKAVKRCLKYKLIYRLSFHFLIGKTDKGEVAHARNLKIEVILTMLYAVNFKRPFFSDCASY